MTTIPAAVARIVAQPAPVLILDTCNFLDLFRRDSVRHQPRVPPEEIQFASEVPRAATGQPAAVHLVVPELVPGEFADHADRIEREFDKWLGVHDKNQEWLLKAAFWVGTALPSPVFVGPLGLHIPFRRLANDLLASSVVLDRDQNALDRAVARVISKRRPSHSKEIKDSMNLEQSLGLCSLLRNGGFTGAVAFISSNTNDYAMPPLNVQIHGDLQAVRGGIVGVLPVPSGRCRIPQGHG